MGNLIQKISDRIRTHPVVAEIFAVDNITVDDIRELYETDEKRFADEIVSYCRSDEDAILDFTSEIKAKILAAMWSLHTERADTGKREEFDTVFSTLMCDISDVYEFVKIIDSTRRNKEEAEKKGTTPPKKEHYANLTSSLAKRVKNFVNSYSGEELKDILDKNDIVELERWVYVADLCHLRETAFELPGFLSSCFKIVKGDEV